MHLMGSGWFNGRWSSWWQCLCVGTTSGQVLFSVLASRTGAAVSRLAAHSRPPASQREPCATRYSSLIEKPHWRVRQWHTPHANRIASATPPHHLQAPFEAHGPRFDASPSGGQSGHSPDSSASKNFKSTSPKTRQNVRLDSFMKTDIIQLSIRSLPVQNAKCRFPFSQNVSHEQGSEG